MMASTRSALRELQRETHRHGHKLLVALAPPAFVVEPRRVAPTFELLGVASSRVDLDAPLRAVKGVLKALRIQSCDLVPPLRAAHKRGARLYFDFDGHWTSEGHRVAAEAMAACLRRQGLE